MKIVVAHPYKQHSFRTAQALKGQNMLGAYITSVYLKKNNLTGIVFQLIDKKNKNRAATHKCEDIDENVIQFCEGEGLFLTLLGRVPQLDGLKKLCGLHFHKRFGQKVAKWAIKNGVDAVVMYDTTARDCFNAIKASGTNIKCILDMSAATLDGRRKSYSYDSERYAGWYRNSINATALKNGIDEAIAADALIVASEYTKRDVVRIGVNPDKVFIIPYGMNFVGEQIEEPAKKGKYLDTIKLLYIGGIYCEKGVHHLLKVVSNLESQKVILSLAGNYDQSNFLYKTYSKQKNISFLGFRVGDELLKIYAAHDILVVPSLSDGYGLVVLEGMSLGLPVIASNCTGASDIIMQYKNGLKYDAYSENELQASIEWMLRHREQISSMGQSAKDSVKALTWERYNATLCLSVEEVINRCNTREE